jgi:hypothetical protein
MTGPIQIWTCAAYHPAYRCGGWAFIRVGQGPVTGAAGGERHTTAPRMALSGLLSALRDPPSEPASASGFSIATTSPELAPFAGFLANLGAPGPEEDLDLWAQIVTAAKGRPLKLVRTPLEPRTPAAFVAAWADLARDKAKASGPFTSAIPKPNLAKIPGLLMG